ncbi:hypothetical protein [Mycolicibacterium tusciae]|uniref:hypothetical protein n=1 Tax=Mycolicibacterium tusciae TaxID=75922 RepID=UPI00024A47DE|nr:hypothetical protein [Mycolicibacterium tusciae]
MSLNEDVPEDLEVLRAIRDAVVASDDVRAEQLASRLTPTESIERSVVDAMDRVRYERGTHRRFTGGLIRWLRRAASDDQTWALARIGVEWWPELALGSSIGGRDDVTREPEIKEEEAERCLAIAAERGHRRAAFKYGTLDSLLTAYGDGTPDDHVSAGDLRSIEARIAEHCADSDDLRASSWFRLAAASPRWEDEDGQATWLAALGGYARWAHRGGDIALCEQLSARVIDDAALEGARDRSAIAADAHKPYRYSYSLAASNESARWQAMEHLLTAHDPSPVDGVELLRLLSRNHFFRVDARDLAAAVWTRRFGPIRDATAVEARAWELLGWLITDAVPDLLRAILCDQEAEHIHDESAGIDFSISGVWEPKPDDESRWSELRDRYWGFGEPLDHLENAEFHAITSFERHPLDDFLDRVFDPLRSSEWLALPKCVSADSGGVPRGRFRWNRPLAGVGIDAVASTYEIGLRTSVFEGERRLLSGSDAWLALWFATTTQEPDGWSRSLSWCDTWDRISPMIAEYINTAATFVSCQPHRRGEDSDLIAAYNRWETNVQGGVRQRIATIMQAATGSD